GRGGDVVRGEDGEAGEDVQPLRELLVERDRAPEQDRAGACQRTPERCSRNGRRFLGDQRVRGRVLEVAGMRPLDADPAIGSLATDYDGFRLGHPLMRSTARSVAAPSGFASRIKRTPASSASLLPGVNTASARRMPATTTRRDPPRSEEHTSEL